MPPRLPAAPVTPEMMPANILVSIGLRTVIFPLPILVRDFYFTESLGASSQKMYG